jgi:hypothetical protein
MSNDLNTVTSQGLLHKASKLRVVDTPEGELALHQADGQWLQPVHVVLAFPLSCPQQGLAIVDEYSKEQLWLDTLGELDADSQAVVQAYLQRRDYRPRITRIVGVNSFATPSVWQVETDHGPCKFELPGEESIRRLSGQRLVLNHANGMQFLIEDLSALDKRSRQLLARFMA